MGDLVFTLCSTCGGSGNLTIDGRRRLCSICSGCGTTGREVDYEAVAAVEHEQWAHWTRYMLNNLTPENIGRWQVQIETPYDLLSEGEKESDREWARKAVDAAIGCDDE